MVVECSRKVCFQGTQNLEVVVITISANNLESDNNLVVSVKKNEQITIHEQNDHQKVTNQAENCTCKTGLTVSPN
jgi:hypothetical protein